MSNDSAAAATPSAGVLSETEGGCGDMPHQEEEKQPDTGENLETLEMLPTTEEGSKSSNRPTGSGRAVEEPNGENLVYLKKLMDALKEENIDAAKQMIRDKKNAATVSTAIWSIIPLFTQYVSTETMDKKYSMYEGCVKMLKNVSKIADPEDLVLCLLQELQQTKDDELFLSLLKPLQTSLIRLPKRKVKFIGWSLHSVYRYLTKLPCPDNYVFEDEDEKILADSDPKVDRVSTVYFDSLPFYDPFVLENRQRRTREMLEITNLLLRFMTNSLDKPFALLDLQIRNKTKSRARRVAERVIENIIMLMPDIYTFLDFRTDRADNKLIRDLPLGVVFYLCLCENVHYDKVPKVYNPIYVFQNALNFCVGLLKADSQFSIERGLCLSEKLMQMVDDNLPHQLLDSHTHSRFCTAITTIMVLNQVKDFRTRSLKIFNTYLHLFNTKGRYLIIVNLTHILMSANVKSYLLGLYKEMWHKEFATNETNISPYFSGFKLLTLLKMFCHLPQSEESDLVELSDQIIASLNIIRYMVLRDKHNLSKIWDYVPELNEMFLEPLKKGLMLSKAHYEARVKDVVEESGLGKRKKRDDDVDIEVSIGGRVDELNDMPTAEKMQMLQAALTTFDVMDSLLSRLNEMIAKKPGAE